jgi:hypothetical protein
MPLYNYNVATPTLTTSIISLLQEIVNKIQTLVMLFMLNLMASKVHFSIFG